MDVLLVANTYAWILSNLLIAYIAIMLMTFVITYFILFDPKTTTAGRLIFQFMVSLAGIIGLVFIGTFVDPASNRVWIEYPGDVASWRPLVRLAVYAFVAYSITSLMVFLIQRKWYPEKLKTSKDLDLVKVRHTSDIPTINP